MLILQLIARGEDSFKKWKKMEESYSHTGVGITYGRPNTKKPDQITLIKRIQ
jgi:hypothetical protein